MEIEKDSIIVGKVYNSNQSGGYLIGYKPWLAESICIEIFGEIAQTKKEMGNKKWQDKFL
jgi:hypothetical protein